MRQKSRIPPRKPLGPRRKGAWRRPATRGHREHLEPSVVAQRPFFSLPGEAGALGIGTLPLVFFSEGRHGWFPPAPSDLWGSHLEDDSLPPEKSPCCGSPAPLTLCSLFPGPGMKCSPGLFTETAITMGSHPTACVGSAYLPPFRVAGGGQAWDRGSHLWVSLVPQHWRGLFPFGSLSFFSV